jgi:hypothetical protein
MEYTAPVPGVATTTRVVSKRTMPFSPGGPRSLAETGQVRSRRPRLLLLSRDAHALVRLNRSGELARLWVSTPRTAARRQPEPESWTTGCCTK